MGRAFGAAADALQSVLGRVPLRYSFAVTPVSIGGLSSDVTAVSLVWEKGNSVCYTSDTPVNPADGTAVFSEVMHQTATVYKQGNTLLPKCYTLKIQAVSNTPHQDTASTTSASTSTSTSTSVSAGKGSRRRTVARARIDLAQFCAAQTAPSTTNEVHVPLEPQGTLVLSIKTVWLQHCDRAQASASAQQQQLVAVGDAPPRRSFAGMQSWGSSTASDEQSYVDCTAAGLSTQDNDKDALNTGSAELDRLLEEAEATTAAKTIAPSAAASSNYRGFSSFAAATTTTSKALCKTHHNSQQQQQPKVVISLASLSSTNGPRGPKKQPQSPLNSAFMAMLSMPSSGGYSSGSGGGSSSSYCSSNASSTYEDSNSSYSSSSSSFATSSFAVVSSSSSGGSKKWHRRASSVPETPTIPESEGEGPDSGSFSAQEAPTSAAAAGAAAAAQDSAQQQQQQQCSALLRDARQHGQLSALISLQQARGGSASIPMPFGLKGSSTASSSDDINDDGGYDAADSDADSDAAVWMDASPSTCRAAARAGASATTASDGPEALRSLSGRMPTWLWPSSRLAVRDLTTDEIMRRISSTRDVAALQGMCRGLLCERNDWRFRATQAERANIALQQELQQLRESEAAAHRQLQEQQSEAQLLQQLVDAKLQLAQADLTQADLRGQLERKRRQLHALKAKLTALQHQVDSCSHEQQQVLNGV